MPEAHWGLRDPSHIAVADPAKQRRSPRRAQVVPLWLRSEQRGRVWEEQTETQMLSRYGAGLPCRHSVEPGGALAVLRRDNGRRATARVIYSRYDAREGRREIGVEILNAENFWELDWSAAPREPGTAEDRAPIAEEPAPESVTAAPAAEPVAAELAAPVGVLLAAPVMPEPVLTDASCGASTCPVYPEPAEGSTAEGVSPADLRDDGEQPRRRDGGATVALPEPRPAERRAQGREGVANFLTAQEQKLWQAIREKDIGALAALLADDVVWVSPEGISRGAVEFAGAIQQHWSACAPAEFTVTRFAKSAALLTFCAEGDARAYHTSLWINRGGRWQLVLHQHTPAH